MVLSMKRCDAPPFWHARSLASLTGFVSAMSASRRYAGAMMPPRALLLLFALAAPAMADEHPVPRGCRNEQDCARQALQRGEIRPLEEVLAVARRAVPGDIVGVELDRDDGMWIYEIKVLTERGRRREIEIDARTLRVLEID
ncbi:PepSY domain-containing protein [Pseudoroseomonas globiformis]|uniref:PepSY domain-containing protein n=1 Tax=Teichococcus globiformis TaxID=2307229 RepID=A0ABV7G2S5_9PROT